MGPSGAESDPASANAEQVRLVPAGQRSAWRPSGWCSEGEGPHRAGDVTHETEGKSPQSLHPRKDVPGETEQGNGSGGFSWGNTWCEIRGVTALGAGALRVSSCRREGLRDCRGSGGHRDPRQVGPGRAVWRTSGAVWGPPPAPGSRTALGVGSGRAPEKGRHGVRGGVRRKLPHTEGPKGHPSARGDGSQRGDLSLLRGCPRRRKGSPDRRTRQANCCPSAGATENPGHPVPCSVLAQSPSPSMCDPRTPPEA